MTQRSKYAIEFEHQVAEYFSGVSSARVNFNKKVSSDLETLQTNLDEYMNRYDNERSRQGKRCNGRTPIATFLDGLKLFK